MKRNTVLKIEAIVGERKLRVLTSYTANIARFTQNFSDILLVGDSLGMVLYNLPSTHGVTIEMMELHTKAVVSSTQTPLILADMPFGSYEASKEKAFENASRLIIAGANAVKIEGGAENSETIKFLIDRGIPVCGHVGLMPQKVHSIGGYGKVKAMDTVLHNFKAVHNAGAFAVVLENISDDISDEIASRFPNAITIGIGAGRNCKGHVAVFEDLLNLSTQSLPPFSEVVFDVKKHTATVLESYFNAL